MHPDIETLIRCLDRKLPPKAMAVVQSHLKQCDVCRLELHRLQVALSVAQTLPGPEDMEASEAGILEGVLAKIRQWEAGRRSPETSGAAVRQRVAERIAVFLGSTAAGKVLDPVSEDNRDLLSRVEPILGEFLGPKAAASLVNHLVDVAIVPI
jgi:anti-sigma factor RsiW